MLRATGPIDWPAQDILRCISYHPLKTQWDINSEETTYLKKVGVNAYVLYMKTKKKFVVAARDFVTNYIQNTEADGLTYYCASSIGVKVQVPEKDSVIRGDCPLAGFLLKPDPTNKNKTNVTIVNEVDLKSSIPDFALRQVLKDQGYQIDRIRKVIVKWKEEFPG